MVRRGEWLTVEDGKDEYGKPKTKVIVLPKGCRRIDFENINRRDEEVLSELALNGRRSRMWFYRHGYTSVVRRLKSRKFIKAVHLGKGNYSYDLDKMGYLYVEMFLSGVKWMDASDESFEGERRGASFCNDQSRQDHFCESVAQTKARIERELFDSP